MKYKLKYDLPVYKAGELFHISKKGNLVHTESGRMAFDRKTLNKYGVLLQWFAIVPEEMKPKTIWDLEDGDECWMCGVGRYSVEIYKRHWSDDPIHGAQLHEARYMNSLFLTREDAIKAYKREKAKSILLRDTKGFKPDWRDETQQKYTVYFDSCYGHLCTDYWVTYISSSIHFATEEDAEASIKAHEKEWKTYLGVEE